MSELVPQLMPKFWILRRADGTRFVEASKYEGYDPKEFHYGSTVVETVLTPDLTGEHAELYKALAQLDHALGARPSPHLRDLLGKLVLEAYEAGYQFREFEKPKKRP